MFSSHESHCFAKLLKKKTPQPSLLIWNVLYTMSENHLMCPSAVSHSQITRLYSRFTSLDKGENGTLRWDNFGLWSSPVVVVIVQDAILLVYVLPFPKDESVLLIFWGGKTFLNSKIVFWWGKKSEFFFFFQALPPQDLLWHDFLLEHFSIVNHKLKSFVFRWDKASNSWTCG